MNQLLEDLRRKKPLLHALLCQQESYEWEGTSLVIRYAEDQSVILDQLRAFKDLLKERVCTITGTRTRVRLEVSVKQKSADRTTSNLEETTTSTAPLPEIIETDLAQRASKDPLVRRFVDTFQGEVENVKEVVNQSGTRATTESWS